MLALLAGWAVSASSAALAAATQTIPAGATTQVALPASEIVATCTPPGQFHPNPTKWTVNPPTVQIGNDIDGPPAAGHLLSVTVPADHPLSQTITISWTGNTSCSSYNGHVEITVTAAAAPGAGSTPKTPGGAPRDPCITPDRGFIGGKTPAERARARQLALAYNENAWDGQQLAEQTDLVGQLLKALLGDAQEDATAPVRAGIAKAFETQETLVAHAQKLETDRKIAALDLSTAKLRQSTSAAEVAKLKREIADLQRRRASGKNISSKTIDTRRKRLSTAQASLTLAESDVARASSRLERVRTSLRTTVSEIAGARRALGDRIRALGALIADIPGAKVFLKGLSLLNPLQDAGAIWVFANSALAAIYNQRAKPPPGCDEPWTPNLPKRAIPGLFTPAVRGLVAAVSQPAARSAAAARPPFKPLAAGPYVTGGQAAAFARFTGSLTDQLATVRALERESRRAGGTSSAGTRRLERRLVRLLRDGPAIYRALATTFAFEPMAATPEALADRAAAQPTARLRARLKGLGAPRSLFAQVAESLDPTAAGELVDPFAVLRDPALDALARIAAAAG
ncbi:MAG TPA: hypothetical protein VMY78_07685 [Solirubrobacteraceae bacterium]|nr:hypothetical protein [Solirubrobacteraceae bacterium]